MASPLESRSASLIADGPDVGQVDLSTGAVSTPAPAARGAPGNRGADRRLHTAGQILLIAAFYGAYTVVRDLRGTRPVSATLARHDAQRIIGFERMLGVFREAQIQNAFLGNRTAVSLLDDWYGSAHFAVTAAVLALLFFIHQHRYRRWRNTLAVATALALLGFALFPVMPPRLLPPEFGFTDTLQTVGGLWNFDSGPMPHLSDQFAAMPSLHFAWALWCGTALYAVSRRWWTRGLAVSYPAITLLCVIVTANHYFADVAAGAVIVVAGYGTALAAERLRRPVSGPPPAGRAPAVPAVGVRPEGVDS